MSDVTFDEPQYTGRTLPPEPKRQSILTRLILKTGLAKDEAGAQKVILILAIIIAVIAIAVYAYGQLATSEGTFIPSNPPAV